MNASKIDDRLTKIATKIVAPSDKLGAPKKKDLWKYFAALSPFVAGVLVAGLGLFVTVTCQARQFEISEADLAVKFFPYITITANDSAIRAQTYSVAQAAGGTIDANTIDDRLNKIGTEIRTLSDKLSAAKQKDFWDYLTALSPFVGGVLVAGVGLYFTIIFQGRQIKINEADLAVKFFPYITAKDESTRTQAYSVIQAVGGALLITRLVEFGGKATEPALIAAQNQSTDRATKQSVQNAIQTVQTVAAAQKVLGLIPDGIVGPQTLHIISRFQAEKGIPVSGRIDARTLEMLGVDPVGPEIV